MILNFQNVEEKILFNKKIRDSFPEIRQIFDQWMLGYKLPTFHHFREQAKIDILNQINKEKLEEFFSEEVIIQKLNRSLTKSISLKELDNFQESYVDFTLTKNKEEVFITFIQ